MTSDNAETMDAGKLQDFPQDLLFQAVSQAFDISLTISPDLTVLDATGMPHVALAVAGWRGKPLLDLFARDSRRKLETRLADPGIGPFHLELNHDPSSGVDLPMRYTLTRLGGRGAVLLLGRDLRPMAEVQQRLIEAQLALQRDHEAGREIETRYRVLMEANGAPIVIISTTTGRIVDANKAALEMIGAARGDLIDSPAAQEFEGRRRGEFLESLTRAATAETPGTVELSVRRTRKRIQVAPTLFRAAGDKLLMCRIDLSEDARAQHDELGSALNRLFQTGVDGMVFLDGDGVIKATNEAFLNLTDIPNTAAVVGRSLADFLSRGETDLKVLLENVKRVGRLRHYATRLNTDFGGQIAVEMSASYLQDRGQGVVGLIIRDASAAEGMRLPAGSVGNEGLRNVMQLVGYSALKEIVAETTEIIEKMCIEAALELTGNNRAAAAELLSLSRQSLYVKLRKFGLLAKAGNE
ncbi:transcriptional regulator PpsR [Rhodobacter sp. KR11]|uniref:transcriptional regulator PpsR n=1 Tax=Rhodobacter sp. KR11 TaxID=2974588 RepID=UPI002223AAEB|nr:transcriptional regulator PpsR [Rhodobacter sp. KR11]MCW1920193.1 transcriptional regulator PpsR [Rhodobacter sp. KR11]